MAHFPYAVVEVTLRSRCPNTCLTANSVSLCGEQPRPSGFVSGGPHFYALGETDGEQSLTILKRTLQLRERRLAVPAFNGDFPVAGFGLFGGIDHSHRFHPHKFREDQNVGYGRILELVKMF